MVPLTRADGVLRGASGIVTLPPVTPIQVAAVRPLAVAVMVWAPVMPASRKTARPSASVVASSWSAPPAPPRWTAAPTSGVAAPGSTT